MTLVKTKVVSEIYEVAQKVWDEVLDDNQKVGIRLGLFPAEVMKEYDTFPSPQFAVALMAVATEKGGMRA
jgi:hypothetical protein